MNAARFVNHYIAAFVASGDFVPFRPQHLDKFLSVALRILIQGGYFRLDFARVNFQSLALLDCVLARRSLRSLAVAVDENALRFF
jgi:hypothetical protein